MKYSTITDNFWTDVAAEAFNKTGMGIKRTAQLKSRGLCCLERERYNKTHEFQAETKDGKPVKKVETPQPTLLLSTFPTLTVRGLF